MPSTNDPDLRAKNRLLEMLRRRFTSRRSLLSLAVSGMVIAGLSYWGSQFPETGAKVVLEDTLLAPASAHYVSMETVAHEGDWYMVHVVVDAPNPFGAMLRHSLCVTYRYTDGHFGWSHSDGTIECSRSPTLDEIAVIKRINDWPGSAPRADAAE